MYISELMTGAPTNERCPLERRMYETLDKLKIPYERVDNDPAASMEECAEVDKVLGTEIRKNVFLCNQKKNGEKKTKTFFVQTDVTLYPIDKEDLHRYVESKDPMDKAGAYGIQGNFAIHVKEIKGDYNNVVGLPIGRVYQELKSL